MKKGGGKGKGNGFERSVCKTLSLWWSEGKDDAIFYRTGGSGGRATKRGRQGKGTVNHCGDVQASDPSGMPLLKLCAIELKRGYNDRTIQDLLDSPTGNGGKEGTCEYEQWMAQAQEAKQHSGSEGWLIILKRDKRRHLVIMSLEVWAKLPLGRVATDEIPVITVQRREKRPSVYLMRLDNLLTYLKPSQVKALTEVV